MEKLAGVRRTPKNRRTAIAGLGILAACGVLVATFGTDTQSVAVVPPLSGVLDMPSVIRQAPPKSATPGPIVPRTTAKPAPRYLTVVAHKSSPVTRVHKSAPVATTGPVASPSPAPVVSGPGVVNGHQYPLCPDGTHYQYYGPKQDQCPHTAANGY